MISEKEERKSHWLKGISWVSDVVIELGKVTHMKLRDIGTLEERKQEKKDKMDSCTQRGCIFFDSILLIVCPIALRCYLAYEYQKFGRYLA